MVEDVIYMKLFRSLQKNGNDKGNIKIHAEQFCVYAPMEGITIKLTDFPDDVFAQGILGKGIGILPAVGEVRAPFDGTVFNVFDTLHAISLISNDGMELIIHVGIDTVNLNGKGFVKITENGSLVKAGDLLMEFNIKQIEKAGYKTATAVCITNTGEYSEFYYEDYGQVHSGQKVFSVKK